MWKPLFSLLSILPLAAFYTNIIAQESTKLPNALEAQGWIITALAAGLAFTRIALWLRGDKNGNGTKTGISNGNGRYEERLQIANLDKILSTMETVLDGISRNQEALLNTANRAMESHATLAVTQKSLLDAVERQTQTLTQLTNELKDRLNG